MAIPQRARRDDNEQDIVWALEAAGWMVYRISERDFPDLVVAKGGRNVLVEVVGEAKFKKFSKSTPRGLSPRQEQLHNDWRLKGPILVAYSAEQILEELDR